MAKKKYKDYDNRFVYEGGGGGGGTVAEHEHGNIQNDGSVLMTTTQNPNGSSLVIAEPNTGKIAKAPITFDGTSTNMFLTKAGTFEEAEVSGFGDAAYKNVDETLPTSPSDNLPTTNVVAEAINTALDEFASNLGQAAGKNVDTAIDNISSTNVPTTAAIVAYIQSLNGMNDSY